MWSLLGKREHKFCKNRLAHMINMAVMPIYGKNLLKSSSPMILILGMKHKRLKFYKANINDYQFYGKVKFGCLCI